MDSLFNICDTADPEPVDHWQIDDSKPAEDTDDVAAENAARKLPTICAGQAGRDEFRRKIMALFLKAQEEVWLAGREAP